MSYTSKIKNYIEAGLITIDKHPALYDYNFQKSLASAPWTEWLSNGPYFEIYDEYLTNIESWIHSSKLNMVLGLDNFLKKDVIIGTTQTFDEAYFRYSSKRLRVFSHEYGYHKRNFLNLKELNFDNTYVPLEHGDWVIVSLPFSGNGNVSKFYNTLIEDATNKNIPVVLDCAWFGTCKNIKIDATHTCIESVSFSLSKGMGMGYMRTGIRYSNLTSGPINQQNNYKHLVFSNMQLALHQMKNFSPDYVQEKYGRVYSKMCNDLGFEETNCIHVAFYNEKLIGVRNLVKQYFKDSSVE